MRDIIKYVSFRDAAANDISKVISAEVGNHDWKLLHAHVIYVSTGDAGDRLVSLTLRDADSNIIANIHAGSYQAASKTYHYSMLQGVYRETVSAVAPTSVDGTIQMSIPSDLIVPSGYTLTISDFRNIQATDDMTISGMIAVLR